MTNSDSLTAAIAALGAVEVAPGRIAVPENGLWFILTPHDVRIIAEDRPEPFTGSSIRMPPWWSPDRRFAWRVTLDSPTDKRVIYEDREPPYGATYHGTRPRYIERITASLITGEEESCG